MFIVSLLFLLFFQLPFEFSYGDVNAGVGIFAGFLDDEDLVVFGACDYLHGWLLALAVIDSNRDVIDAAVVSGQLFGFFDGVGPEGIRDFNVFACNSKKQNKSPS